jgi:hypothetical protein
MCGLPKVITNFCHNHKIKIARLFRKIESLLLINNYGNKSAEPPSLIKKISVLNLNLPQLSEIIIKQLFEDITVRFSTKAYSHLNILRLFVN